MLHHTSRLQEQGGQTTLLGAITVPGVVAVLPTKQAGIVALTHTRLLMQAFTDCSISGLEVHTTTIIAP